MHIPIVLTPDDNGTFLVTSPLLSEVTSFGETEADALEHAKDAVLTALDYRIRNRQSIPVQDPDLEGATAYGVDLPALVEIKVGLHNAMVEGNVRKADLGRLLDMHPPQIDRLLDLDHASKLDQMEAALAAVGRRMTVSVLQAA